MKFFAAFLSAFWRITVLSLLAVNTYILIQMYVNLPKWLYLIVQLLAQITNGTPI